jgi:cysteine desulfuration protein SufE
VTLDDYVDTFELFDDWDQRYQYLTELGDQLQDLPDTLRTEENRVKGCMSQVWVSAYLQPSGPSGSSELVGFHADCDTPTIKGVLALLVDLMSEKPVADVLATDLDEIFDRLSLDDHLSPNRHFGIYAIVTLMKEQTGQLTSKATA